jgi:hypothetical protein
VYQAAKKKMSSDYARRVQQWAKWYQREILMLSDKEFSSLLHRVKEKILDKSEKAAISAATVLKWRKGLHTSPLKAGAAKIIGRLRGEPYLDTIKFFSEGIGEAKKGLSPLELEELLNSTEQSDKELLRALASRVEELSRQINTMHASHEVRLARVESHCNAMSQQFLTLLPTETSKNTISTPSYLVVQNRNVRGNDRNMSNIVNLIENYCKAIGITLSNYKDRLIAIDPANKEVWGAILNGLEPSDNNIGVIGACLRRDDITRSVLWTERELLEIRDGLRDVPSLKECRQLIYGANGATNGGPHAY